MNWCIFSRKLYYLFFIVNASIQNSGLKVLYGINNGAFLSKFFLKEIYNIDCKLILIDNAWEQNSSIAYILFRVLLLSLLVFCFRESDDKGFFLSYLKICLIQIVQVLGIYQTHSWFFIGSKRNFFLFLFYNVFILERWWCIIHRMLLISDEQTYTCTTIWSPKILVL